MRFETRYDRPLIAALVLVAFWTCLVLPVTSFLRNPHGVGLWLSLIPLVVWIVVLRGTLPQYYDVREDGLFLRQGLLRLLIPYQSIAELTPASDATSAGVFSTHRIILRTAEGKCFVTAIAEEDRFLAEVLKRCPQLVCDRQQV